MSVTAVALALSALVPYAVAPCVTGRIVGVSRRYLVVHDPGDVLVGWLLAPSAFAVGSLLC
jgi:membrane-associated phospholipid phosphatase